MRFWTAADTMAEQPRLLKWVVAEAEGRTLRELKMHSDSHAFLTMRFLASTTHSPQTLEDDGDDDDGAGDAVSQAAAY